MDIKYHTIWFVNHTSIIFLKKSNKKTQWDTFFLSLHICVNLSLLIYRTTIYFSYIDVRYCDLTLLLIYSNVCLSMCACACCLGFSLYNIFFSVHMDSFSSFLIILLYLFSCLIVGIDFPVPWWIKEVRETFSLFWT